MVAAFDHVHAGSIIWSARFCRCSKCMKRVHLECPRAKHVQACTSTNVQPSGCFKVKLSEMLSVCNLPLVLGLAAVA